MTNKKTKTIYLRSLVWKCPHKIVEESLQSTDDMAPSIIQCLMMQNYLLHSTHA